MKMKILSGLVFALFMAAITTLFLDYILKLDVYILFGIFAFVFVSALTLSLGFGIAHFFFGTQMRSSLTSSTLGALFGAGLVWFPDQSGLIKPEQLKFAYIVMTAIFLGIGLFASFIRDYTKKEEYPKE